MIPCYNAAEFVGDAIRSTLEQTWPNVEVVVVDDASTDSSAQAITAFGDRVRIVRLGANSGGSFARNRGAEVSSGELLLFLDADDLLAPDTIEHMVNASRANPGSLIACRFSYFLKEGERWTRSPARTRVYADGDQLLAWLEGNWSPPCCILWPREVFERTGGWNESLTRNDDGDLVMRALSKGTPIKGAQGGEALYRRHRGTRQSVSTTRGSERHLRSAFQVLVDLSAELDSQNRLTPYARAISEDLAEIALLSFRAGFPSLGAAVTEASRRLRSRSPRAPGQAGTGDRDSSPASIVVNRFYAASVRSRGQARRWLKRRNR